MPTEEAIGHWAEAERIDFLDLTPGLVDAASWGELVYFLDDAHWTSAGQAVVTDLLMPNGGLDGQ